MDALAKDLGSIYEQCRKKVVSSRSNTRQQALGMLKKAVQSAVASEVWVERMECSLYYATGCDVDARYLRCVRDASANLRRTKTAIQFPPDTWPFLSLVVLSRDNEVVHLERLQYLLRNFEKTGQISDLDRERVEREMSFYEGRQQWEQLAAQLEACSRQPEEEADWESNIACPECNSKKTKFLYELQMRSADEPMTAFFKCFSCGAPFKLE